MTAKKKKSKKEIAKKSSLKDKQEFDWLHQIAFWGLALLLFFPPYFRGLFFAPEQEKALMFATLVFWLTFLWRWLQNDHKFLRGPLDWFALALPVVYIISTFTAVNKGYAIDEVVKNILYFLTYWSASRLVRNEEDVHKLLHVIYVSAIGVALAGLATATGIVHIKDGFLNGRIYSSFQYPNALASYLAAILLIGMYLWCRSKNYTLGKITGQSSKTSLQERAFRFNPWGYLYAGGNFLLLAILLGTKSKGGLLVFGLVFLIYITGLVARDRLAVTLHAVFNGAIAYLCVTKFITLALNNQYDRAWIWILAGLIFSQCSQLIYQLISRFSLKTLYINDRKINLFFYILAGLGIFSVGTWFYKQKELLQNILDFNFLRNAIERAYFVEDAVEMFLAKPLLGWGGGGWKEAYHYFQNYMYNSNEVHSYYFQVAVETGLLGVLVVFGVWFSFLYYAYRLFKNRKNNPDMFQTSWVLVAAFLAIAIHAFMDFDLSLSALTLVTWTILGLVGNMVNRSLYKVKPNPQEKHANYNYNKMPIICMSLVSIVIMIFSFTLIFANVQALQAGKYLSSRQVDKALIFMEKASLYNPFNSSHHVVLSQIYMANKNYQKSLDEAQRAVALSPYNSHYRFVLADAYRALGKYDLAIKQTEKAVEMGPFQRQWYEMLANTYFILGYEMLENNKKELAYEYLQKASKISERMQAQIDRLPEKYKKMWKDGPLLIPNETISFITGAANYQLGKYDQAQEFLQRAVEGQDNSIEGKALIWLALTANQNGQKEKSEMLLKQAEEIMSDAVVKYNHINGLPILK